VVTRTIHPLGPGEKEDNNPHHIGTFKYYLKVPTALSRDKGLYWLAQTVLAEGTKTACVGCCGHGVGISGLTLRSLGGGFRVPLCRWVPLFTSSEQAGTVGLRFEAEIPWFSGS